MKQMKQKNLTRFGSKQQGFTILEIMIAMTLGLILLTGVVSLMIGNKRSFNEQSEMSRLHENARFAMKFLTDDIRMTNYVGCMGDISNMRDCVGTGSNWCKTTNALLDDPQGGGSKYGLDIAVTGVEGAGTNADSITIVYLGRSGLSMTADMGSRTAPVSVSSTGGYVVGDKMVLADCTMINVFEVTGVDDTDPDNVLFAHAGGVNQDSGQLTQAFLMAESDFLEQNSYTYSIADTDGDGITSLYRSVGAPTNNDELVRGVENMQVLYGDGTQYKNATNVINGATAVSDPSLETNWGEIVSVKISLLIRTEDEIGSDVDAGNYDLLGTVVAPAANLRVRRRVFSATIAMRNRLDSL